MMQLFKTQTRGQQPLPYPIPEEITPEWKTSLVLAALTNGWVLGYCWGKNIISDGERNIIMAAQRALRLGV
jgi:hypothetical protein